MACDRVGMVAGRTNSVVQWRPQTLTVKSTAASVTAVPRLSHFLNFWSLETQ